MDLLQTSLFTIHPFYLHSSLLTLPTLFLFLKVRNIQAASIYDAFKGSDWNNLGTMYRNNDLQTIGVSPFLMTPFLTS